MILPSLGDSYPMPNVGPHAGHDARIVAVDLHGEASWEDAPLTAPSITVRCECGHEWTDDLIEAAVTVTDVRRRTA